MPCCAMLCHAVPCRAMLCRAVLLHTEDPIGLLPPRLILGINKRGVHFFRPVPKEYLHSAELRDIMQVRLVYVCAVGGAGCVFLCV